MELGYTFPLQRRLGITPPPYGQEADLRFCWDVHSLAEGRLLVIHASSAFALTLAAPEAGWQTAEAALAAIRAGLEAEGFPPAAIARYFSAAGPVSVTRTHGRRSVAFLNQAVDALALLPAPGPGVESGILNLRLCRAAGHPDRGRPRDFLWEDLADFIP